MEWDDHVVRLGIFIAKKHISQTSKRLEVEQPRRKQVALGERGPPRTVGTTTVRPWWPLLHSLSLN